MQSIAVLLGLLLAGEGVVKQFRPKQYMAWLVDRPLAYLPESLLAASREIAALSPSTLRLLGLLELGAGATILLSHVPCCRRQLP